MLKNFYFSFLLFVFCISSAISQPIPDNILFNVYRNDSKIGYHKLTFSQDQDFIKSKINIEFEVNFLGLTLYEYSHQNIEFWKNNSLQKLATNTDKNGDLLNCNFEKKDDNYQIDGSSRKKLVKNSLIPTSYWNKIIVDNKFLKALNTQDCSDLDFTISYIGQGFIYNNSLLADHFKLIGKESSGEDVDIDLWYDEKNRWVKMIFVKDGSKIEYILDRYDSN